MQRKLEDKLLASRIEMRAFTLNLDLSEIHGNRDLPSAFICYLGVCDATLPLKGTAHRSIRGAPAPDDRTNVLLELFVDEHVGVCVQSVYVELTL